MGNVAGVTLRPSHQSNFDQQTVVFAAGLANEDADANSPASRVERRVDGGLDQFQSRFGTLSQPSPVDAATIQPVAPSGRSVYQSSVSAPSAMLTPTISIEKTTGADHHVAVDPGASLMPLIEIRAPGSGELTPRPKPCALAKMR